MLLQAPDNNAHTAAIERIHVAQTRDKKRAIRRIVRELNPLHWPLGALILAREAVLRLRPALTNSYTYSHVSVPTQKSLDTLMEWIAFGQDKTPGGGLPAYYSLYGGFGPGYPEVTGYWVPTLLDYASWSGKEQFRKRALRAADWLCGLQMAGGAFPGGYALKDDGPSVFNTGQIIFGLVAAWKATQDHKYLRAAQRAAEWLASIQSEDGAWRKHTYEGVPHVYYTMVSWALAEAFKETGEEAIREAALRQVKWVMAQQQPDGWLDGHNLGKRPTFLHFIAYTIQGLLEVGCILEFPESIESARKAAEALMRQFEIRKVLGGAYAPGWKRDGNFACLTGNAQIAIVWGRLSKVLGDLRFLNAALKMNELLKGTMLHGGPRSIRGAIKGSQPIWGSYLSMRYPSWAAKFTADSFLLEVRTLAELEKSLNVCGT